jgi:hypothetical protein
MVVPQIPAQFTGLPPTLQRSRPRRAAAPRPRSAERLSRQPDDVLELKHEEMIFDALSLGTFCLADCLRSDQGSVEPRNGVPHPDDSQPQRGVLANPPRTGGSRWRAIRLALRRFVVPDQMRHRVRRGAFARPKFTTAVRDGRLRCGEQESLTTSPVDDDEPVDRRLLWFSVVHAVRSARTVGELSLRSSCPA